ncbi:hypothetical protein DVH29_09175 [Pelagibacterium lacus]|uniref:Uncharacterized protein n=1 Tax=Pelagibacterium lacus TaxID=2282655 RepID=A0A369W3K0_9HYPH|nr:hypothetical protein DVH29_09175 [Pelagibacterium lacus]
MGVPDWICVHGEPDAVSENRIAQADCLGIMVNIALTLLAFCIDRRGELDDCLNWRRVRGVLAFHPRII